MQPRVSHGVSKEQGSERLSSGEDPVNADDLIAVTCVALGAIASSALTVVVLRRDTPTATCVEARPPYVTGSPETLRRRVPFVDFAIIRDGPETMVGPEGPETGWMPRVDSGPAGRWPR